MRVCVEVKLGGGVTVDEDDTGVAACVGVVVMGVATWVAVVVMGVAAWVAVVVMGVEACVAVVVTGVTLEVAVRVALLVEVTDEERVGVAAAVHTGKEPESVPLVGSQDSVVGAPL